MSEQEEGLWYANSQDTRGPFGYLKTGCKSWCFGGNDYFQPSGDYCPTTYTLNTRLGPVELARWGSD